MCRLPEGDQLVKPDCFPLPRVQGCFDSMAGSDLFTTFDLTSGYFQIPVKTEDIPKTAFACKYGQLLDDNNAMWVELFGLYV